MRWLRGGLEASSQGSSDELPGTGKGLMASYRQAADQIKELLEIQLPVRVDVQSLHHAVKDTGVLLVLQKHNDSNNDNLKSTSRLYLLRCFQICCHILFSQECEVQGRAY